MADPVATPEGGALSVPRAHVVLWGALGGGLIGLLVLFADLPTWDDEDFDRARDGTFGLWAAAIAAQTMVWALAFPAIREISRRRRTPEAARSREVVPFGVVTIAVSSHSGTSFGTRFWKNELPSAPLGKRCMRVGRPAFVRRNGSATAR